ncbi:MAG: ABC transporter substrate-binding protein [Marinobacter sp.]|nr:ABC transporter substrate-binding protein [Marinobacter sp.]MDX1633295.1 ABC transporter substrate-binding protein [Marinobacter sp.]
MGAALIVQSSQALAVDILIGYIQWQPDPGPVLSNVLPEPEDAGLRGAELGIDDNNSTGRFLNQKYILKAVVAADETVAMAALEALVAEGIDKIVLNVPANTLQAMADRATELQAMGTRSGGRQVLLFNASAREDHLRVRDCRPNVLHTHPSHAMLTDALAQWANSRRWTDVFLITGATEGDLAWAESFRRASKRFGLDIVEHKPWTFDADLRRTASKELPLFTQGPDYDLVVVADERGDFGEYVPYNTWLPRPVAGTAGMTPVAWHRVVESWGAAQLQNRFTELAKRDMNSKDYAAWAAVRSVGTALTQIQQADADSVRAFLLSDEFELAAFKGRPLTYRNWNGQLRQPIPLVHPRGLVTQAPIEGFLHPKTELDTLGYDEPESQCRIQQP